MTQFDLIAVAVILISGLVGFTRGAVRELVTVLAFGVAAFAAVWLLPFAGPVARGSVKPEWAANAVAVAVVFVLAYIALRLLGGWLAAQLHSQAALGAVDRTIGLGFGVLRAVIFLGVFYLVFNAVTPPELSPAWFTRAKLYPVARASAETLESLAPRGLKSAGRLGPALERAAKTDPSKGPPEGYDRRAREKIDALVERSR